MRLSTAVFFVALLCYWPLTLADEDYYDILGIGKDADNREIRKAFKKLALKVSANNTFSPLSPQI